MAHSGSLEVFVSGFIKFRPSPRLWIIPQAQGDASQFSTGPISQLASQRLQEIERCRALSQVSQLPWPYVQACCAVLLLCQKLGNMFKVEWNSGKLKESNSDQCLDRCAQVFSRIRFSCNVGDHVLYVVASMLQSMREFNPPSADPKRGHSGDCRSTKNVFAEILVCLWMSCDDLDVICESPC